MDQTAETIEAYRKLLRGDLPMATRRAIEWLMVEAARKLLDLPAGRTPWNGYELPSVIAIANEAAAEAARLMGSDYAAVQLYLEPQDTLVLVANRNFPAELVALFAAFRPDFCTGCSRAVASGGRVVIPDVERDEPFTRHVPAALDNGFRSLQATPLKAESGAVIGVITTHFAEPRSYANDDFDRFDAHARNVSRDLARACA